MPLDTPGISITPLDYAKTFSLEWLRSKRPLIDSAKSVSSAAGWCYTDNGAVRALLRYMLEGLPASKSQHLVAVARLHRQ